MLKIKNVSVEFMSGHRVKAVDGVDMEIEKGSRTAIIGETGSGKSILLLSVLQLLPQSASVTGEVIFEGVNLLSLSKTELEKIRGSRISYIPQGSGNGLNPLLKVGFQVGEPLMEHRGYTKKRAFHESIGLLQRFNLGEEKKRAHAYPHTFSGGMKQRALVAMGISAGAGMILADEPTKGLDYGRIGRVIECFRQLKTETVLCVTHDLNFAAAIGDVIAVMYAAQLVELAEKEAFFRQPLHPYSKAMINALPENGLKPVPGFAPSHDAYPSEGCRFYERCACRKDVCRSAPPWTAVGERKVRCWNYVD